MEYAAKVTREGRYWLAEFPDCPGAQTFASSRAELAEMAREALEAWLMAELAARRVPPRHKVRRGAAYLRVPIAPLLAAKIALRQARDAAGLSQAELARRLGISQQAVAKLEDPDRNVELGTLERVAEALGYAVALDLVPT